ncbi:MAG: hypothetical protein ACLPV2_11075 [Steroidobacteraceae bacterium]
MFIKSRTIGTSALALLVSACGQSGDKSSGGDSNASDATSLTTAPVSTLVADDCNRRISAATAADVLGVAKAKENVYVGHYKGTGGIDYLECGYSEASPDPYAPFFKFVVLAPLAADIESVYRSQSRPPGVQTIDTRVGTESFGWIRAGVGPGLFEVHITFRTASNIFDVTVGSVHGADAATAAALKLAGRL